MLSINIRSVKNHYGDFNGRDKEADIVSCHFSLWQWNVSAVGYSFTPLV